MALVVADRVKETTTSTGTGAISLGGAEPNFRTFSSVLSDADTTYYAIIDDNNLAFEVGLGTYASSGNTITRTTVLSSSNSNNAVNFSAGTKDVFLTYPADKSVNRDASGNVSVSGGVTATSFTGPITATQVDLTGQGDLRLQDASGGQYVALQAPATVGSSFTFTLPSADGSADQLLKTDGSGNLSFATINASPSFTATAKGAISDGDPVVVNYDGTVSKAGKTADSAGSQNKIADDMEYMSSCYDEANNRVVVAYRDSSDGTGYAVVGSVSGTTLSWGTPVQFTSDSVSTNSQFPLSISYDKTAERVLIVWSNNSNQPTGIVGSVSGTSISFGTPSTWSSNTANFLSSVYVESVNKHLICYQDQTESYYGRGVVATVTGASSNTVTFGTITSFQSHNSRYFAMDVDPRTGAVCLAYKAQTGTYGRIQRVTISGTTPSFSGIQTYFSYDQSGGSSTTAEYVSVAYNGALDRFGIIFQGGGSDGFINTVAPTVSDGGTLSGSDSVFMNTTQYYGRAREFETGNLFWNSVIWFKTSPHWMVFYDRASNGEVRVLDLDLGPGFANEKALLSANYSRFGDSHYQNLVYDPDTDQAILIAQYTSDGHGYAEVFNPDRTNVGKNFVGIADAAYSDGATATIQITGAIDDAQSGLTPGQAYYLSRSGELVATAENGGRVNSMQVGVAISPTKLLINGQPANANGYALYNGSIT
jgi:hypothetical protein